MYRIVLENDFIQKVVSKEMAAGFRIALGIKENEYEIEKEALAVFCKGNNALIQISKSEENLDFLKLKLETMLKEIEDTENEFTFDCFGEYLLYVIMQHVADIMGYGETSEEFSWVSSVTKEERSKVYSIIQENYLVDCEEDTEELEKDINILTERITNFPKMVDEANDEEPLFDILFWDRDFLLYEEADVETVNKFIGKNKGILGYIEADENEPGSGSLKKPLQKK